jgi:HSP20 family molecular chaperone IbpA
VPSHLGERVELSAKWRRNKNNPRRSSIFRVLRKTKEKDVSDMFRFKSAWARKKPSAAKFVIQKTNGRRKARELQPLVDVLEENDEVIVVAEFAGFDKEHIRANAKSQRLTLLAEAADRKFYKSLNLPKRVIPNTIRTAYKNGVLEVRLKKVIESKALDSVAG